MADKLSGALSSTVDCKGDDVFITHIISHHLFCTIMLEDMLKIFRLEP